MEQFIVIEKWENLPSPWIVTDEEGVALIFDNKEDAQKEADDCQDGIVVLLN